MPGHFSRRGPRRHRHSRGPGGRRPLVRRARPDRRRREQRRLRALPHLRAQGGGRIIQISSYGGQVAFPGNSLYHATKWGIEGFCESLAQEVAGFGIGVTIVEPGGARTEFRYGSARVATLMPAYEETSAHSFLRMLDPATGLAPGDPARMAAHILESVDRDEVTWSPSRLA